MIVDWSMVYAINDQGRLAGLWRKLLMISEGLSSLVFAIIAQRRYIYWSLAHAKNYWSPADDLNDEGRITSFWSMPLMMREVLPVYRVFPL